MLSSMEVDCSLDEFAQVLAVNGYINDDSCFADTDLPSMLSALDSASVLDSPDSFPDSPCSDDDLSRVLELAQLPSPSLLQTCLPDNFSPSKASHHSHGCTNNNHNNNNNNTIGNNNINNTSLNNHNHRCNTFIHHQQSNMMRLIAQRGNVNKSRDPCIANAVLGHPIDSLSLTLRDGIENAHKELRLDKSILEEGDPFSVSFFDAKDVINNNNNNNNNNCFEGSSIASHSAPSEAQGIDIMSSAAHHLDRSDNGGCDVAVSAFSPTAQQEHRAPIHDNATSVSDVANQAAAVKPTEPPKQKRKRKSKGYSKPSKSRRKKVKTGPEPSLTTPDIKTTEPKAKPKSRKSGQASASTVKSGQNAGGGHLLSEDSGFESAEKDAMSDSGSSDATTPTNNNNNNSSSSSSGGDRSDTANRSDNAVSPSGSLEGSNSSDPSLSPPEGETRTLRRSTRSTRNTENYNFRLSSLVKRVETERRQKEPKQPKGKVKPAPLSKYRRRTANARERDRMKEINEAFDKLKESLPDVQRDDGKQKITKFTILKLALNYIATLRDMLGYGDAGTIADGDDLSSPGTVSSSLSVCPASVTSLLGEDSCSSSTSGHSDTDHPIKDTITSIAISLASSSSSIASLTTTSPQLPPSSALSSSSSSSSAFSSALFRSLSLPATIPATQSEAAVMPMMNYVSSDV